MLLTINDRMTLGEVEDKFEECFPGLTLCFYSKDHQLFEKTDERFRYDPHHLIGDVRRKHWNDVYEIKSWFTVAQVENDLREKFGLFAQVCRLQQGKIVQTASTDKLTLQQQSGLIFQKQ